jgi:hypothetical protein
VQVSVRHPPSPHCNACLPCCPQPPPLPCSALALPLQLQHAFANQPQQDMLLLSFFFFFFACSLPHPLRECCSEGDLCLTLSLTLEPDLSLRFPNKQLYQIWQRGLQSIVGALNNPGDVSGRWALPSLHARTCIDITSPSLLLEAPAARATRGRTARGKNSTCPDWLLLYLGSADNRSSTSHFLAGLWRLLATSTGR